MNTIIETEEIEAPAYLDDPKVLAYLSGTDADLDRLVLEDDGMLWAYSKRSPEDLCRFPLLSMVTLAFPKYAPSPQTPPAYPEATVAPMAQPAVPERPKASQRPRSGPCASAVPVTGAARGMLAAFKNGRTGGRPMVKMDGQRVPCPAPEAVGENMHIVVVADLVFQGYALVPRSAYKLMADSTLRPDTLMFKLVDGLVTTQVRKSADDTYAQPVVSLLAELGSDTRIVCHGLPKHECCVLRGAPG